jgi:hypothetical protein
MVVVVLVVVERIQMRDAMKTRESVWMVPEQKGLRESNQELSVVQPIARRLCQLSRLSSRILLTTF